VHAPTSDTIDLYAKSIPDCFAFCILFFFRQSLNLMVKDRHCLGSYVAIVTVELAAKPEIKSTVSYVDMDIVAGIVKPSCWHS